MKHDFSDVFRFDLDVDPARVLRNKVGKTIGPFDDANAVAEKIFIESEALHRWSIFESDEVEMVNWQAATDVFVNNREGGARDDSIGSQPCDKPFNELRFACAEIAFQGEHVARFNVVREPARELFRLVRAIGNERSHLLIADCRLLMADGETRCV